MALRCFRVTSARAGLVCALAFPATFVATGCGGGDAFTSSAAGTGGGAAAGGSDTGTGGGPGAGKGGSGGTAAASGGAGSGAGTGATGGGSGKGGAGPGGGAAQGGGGAGQGGGAGGGPPACDPAEKPVTGALHVVAGASDQGADGTEAKPFGTLAGALVAQKMGRGATPVVLAPGTYDAAADIAPASSGAKVTIAGGWTATFTRDCTATAPDQTILTATAAGAPAVVTIESGETITLRSLTVKTRDQAETANHDQPGKSLFALVVHDGADLTLDRVTVSVGNAGQGGPSSPTGPAAPAMCNGTTDCASGEAGTDGPPGPPGGAGAFSDAGYSPGNGTPGGMGLPGKNGKPGKPGESGPCVACSGDAASCTAATDLLAASTGACGCGGEPAGPATPGHGGGASVAVLAVGGASVTLLTSKVAAGAGGDGSTPSDPGVPAQPTQSTMGAPLSCEESNSGSALCTYSPVAMKCVPANVTEVPLKGGAAGTAGGPAGKGGKAGGGSGGPSVAIVHSGGAKITVDTTSILMPGAGGKGTAGAPNGMMTAQLGY